MTYERKTGTRTYQVTETTYEFRDTPGQYRIIEREGDRFMDVEYRPTAWPFHGGWERLDTTDLTEKAISRMEAHAEQKRQEMLENVQERRRALFRRPEGAY